MNWIFISILMALFQTAPISSQQQQQTRPQDRGSVTGFVLKMGTADPVSKATVTISPFSGGRNQSYTATTTSSGQFSFQNLDPGQYRLSVTRNGYVRMYFGR